MVRQLSSVEERFCNENALDNALALGGRFDASPIKSRHDAIWIEAAEGFDSGPILPQIDTLEIHGTARFANAIIKFTTAFAFAKKYGIKEIYHSGFDFLEDDTVVGSIRVRKGQPKGGKILRSAFYYNVTLRPLSHPMMSKYEVIQLIKDDLKFLLLKRDEGSRKELTIHVRSGDIFKDETPHFAYGQPPLAFYQLLLEAQPWDFVRLVYEDDLNPTIPALKDLLVETNTPFKTISKSLKEDIEALSEASYLAIGIGTFIYPVLCFSPNAKVVYCFETDRRNSWGLQNSGITFVSVLDEVGAYKADILTDWKNTPEQNALMLSYPKENLRFASRSN